MAIAGCSSPGNQISGSWTDGAGESQVHIRDSAIGRAIPFRFEGGTAHEELIGQYAETPYVRRGVMLARLDHLRRQVIQRTTESGAAGRGCMHRPAEVSDLNVAL